MGMATRNSGTREHFRKVAAPQVGCGMKIVDSLSRKDNLLSAVGGNFARQEFRGRHVDRDSGLRHVKVDPFHLIDSSWSRAASEIHMPVYRKVKIKARHSPAFASIRSISSLEKGSVGTSLTLSSLMNFAGFRCVHSFSTQKFKNGRSRSNFLLAERGVSVQVLRKLRTCCTVNCFNVSIPARRRQNVFS
jgi:hypothetical protein